MGGAKSEDRNYSLHEGAVAPPSDLEEVARAMTMACSSPLMKVKGFLLVRTK